MRTFVAEENVRVFRRRLLDERDLSLHATLRDLLSREEDKLKVDLDHLHRLEHDIAECQTRIARQRASMDAGEENSGDAAQARALLDSYMETLALHEAHWRKMKAQLGEV